MQLSINYTLYLYNYCKKILERSLDDLTEDKFTLVKLLLYIIFIISSLGETGYHVSLRRMNCRFESDGEDHFILQIYLIFRVS